jgi:hypothetical protein
MAVVVDEKKRELVDEMTKRRAAAVDANMMVVKLFFC